MDPFADNTGDFGMMGEQTQPDMTNQGGDMFGSAEPQNEQPVDMGGMDMGMGGGDMGMGGMADMGGMGDMGAMGGDMGAMGGDMGAMGGDMGAMGGDMGGDMGGMGGDSGMGMGGESQGDFGMGDMGAMGGDSGMGMGDSGFGAMSSEPQGDFGSMEGFDAAPQAATPSFDAPPPVAARSDSTDDDFTIVRKWNADWRDKLARKDAEHAAKKQENMKAAQKQLDDYYNLRSKSKMAKMEQNRTEERELLASLEQDKHIDNPWKRVCKMVDLGNDLDKTRKDVTRFKSILIKLKDKPLSVSRQLEVRA